jgi:hypothetical protein
MRSNNSAAPNNSFLEFNLSRKTQFIRKKNITVLEFNIENESVNQELDKIIG